MIGRLRILSVALALIGIGFLAAGGFAYFRLQEGSRSLNAYSSAQNVTLEYSAAGQLGGDDPTESQAHPGTAAESLAIPGRGLGPQP